MTTTLAPQDSLNMAQAQWLEVETAKWSNGVLSGKRNTFTVTTTSGLGISVNTGDSLVQGFGFWADAATALTCAAADPTNPRIDRAVLHADLTAHTATIILLTGTPGPSPTPPALTQTGTVWEVSLYQIRVNANQTTLTGGSLTDERTYATPNVANGAITSAQIVSVAASQVTAGTFPVGVIEPATQIGAGALPASVTSPNYLPLAGGTMTGDTNIGSGTGAGVGHINDGTATRRIGWANIGGGPESGIYDETSAVSVSSGSNGGVLTKVNNKWNGTNDLFIDAVRFAIEVLTRGDINSGMPSVRTSTNTPAAGGTITWTAFAALASLNSAGGGAAGVRIWEGTTDPGTSAVEGDLWFKG